MLTTGEIRSVNYANCSCVVEVTLFKDPGDSFPDDGIIRNVGLIASPGVQSGYKAGDKVVVCFLENNYLKPVVIGKYIKEESTNLLERLGVSLASLTGQVNCKTLIAVEANIPITTVLRRDNDENVQVQEGQNISTILDLVNTVIKQQEIITQLMNDFQEYKDATNATLADLDERVKALEGC